MLKILERVTQKLKLQYAGRDRMEREIVKTYPDAEYMDTWVWFQSGVNTDGAHNPKTNRKLVKGDILIFKYFPNDLWILHGIRKNIIFRSCRR